MQRFYSLGLASMLERPVRFLSEERNKSYKWYGAVSTAGENRVGRQEASRVSGSAGKQAGWHGSRELCITAGINIPFML